MNLDVVMNWDVVLFAGLTAEVADPIKTQKETLMMNEELYILSALSMFPIHPFSATAMYNSSFIISVSFCVFIGSATSAVRPANKTTSQFMTTSRFIQFSLKLGQIRGVPSSAQCLNQKHAGV